MLKHLKDIYHDQKVGQFDLNINHDKLNCLKIKFLYEVKLHLQYIRIISKTRLNDFLLSNRYKMASGDLEVITPVSTENPAPRYGHSVVAYQVRSSAYI